VSFVLDTSVAIPLRDGDLDVITKVEALGGPFALSIISRVELEGGLYSQPRKAAVRRERLAQLLTRIPTLAFDDVAAQAYGKILASAGYSRRKVIDRMIAAQAIVHRATLVTLNAADFSDVPNLQLLAL
jgi:predicted nucleic acid-binding protein